MLTQAVHIKLPVWPDRHNPSPIEMEFGGISKRLFFVIVGQLLGGHNVHFKAIIKKKKSSIIQLGAYKIARFSLNLPIFTHYGILKPLQISQIEQTFVLFYLLELFLQNPILPIVLNLFLL